MKVQTAARLRPPTSEDGVKVWELVRDTGVLDLNTPYCYIMFCDYFRSTCVIAEEGGEVVGYLSAFRSPKRADTLFVWQVAVARSHRRQGLGTRMLKSLLSREGCRDFRYVEATVSPSNTASSRLFGRLAEEYNTNRTIKAGYDISFFPAGAPHEAEPVHRVGPFSVK